MLQQIFTVRLYLMRDKYLEWLDLDMTTKITHLKCKLNKANM